MLAISVVVCWLLLPFSRTLRALRRAGAAPIGRVGSAVMLHGRLRRGMTLMQLPRLAGSLGERVSPADEGADGGWRWREAGDASVTFELTRGRTPRLAQTGPRDVTPV